MYLLIVSSLKYFHSLITLTKMKVFIHSFTSKVFEKVAKKRKIIISYRNYLKFYLNDNQINFNDLNYVIKFI